MLFYICDRIGEFFDIRAICPEIKLFSREMVGMENGYWRQCVRFADLCVGVSVFIDINPGDFIRIFIFFMSYRHLGR